MTTLTSFRTLVALSLFVGFMNGCSAKPDEPFLPEPVSEAGNARVYVYWPPQGWREKAGSSLEVQVDGVPVGLLEYKTYIPLEVRAGVHEFRVTGEAQSADWEAEWEGEDKFFETRLKPGEIKFVRLLIKYDQQKNTWTNPGMEYVVQFLPRSAATARMELAELKATRY
jgi:hypothetical protein